MTMQIGQIAFAILIYKMGIIDSGRNKRPNIYKFVSAVPHIFLTYMVIKDFPKSSINYYANLYILVNFLYKCISWRESLSELSVPHFSGNGMNGKIRKEENTKLIKNIRSIISW